MSSVSIYIKKIQLGKKRGIRIEQPAVVVPVVPSYLLQQNGDYILQQNGDKIELN